MIQFLLSIQSVSRLVHVAETGVSRVYPALATSGSVFVQRVFQVHSLIFCSSSASRYLPLSVHLSRTSSIPSWNYTSNHIHNQHLRPLAIMAAPTSSGTLDNGLRDVQRFITDHDSEGKAIFSKDIPSTSSWQQISPEFNFFLGYTTKGFPVDLNSSKVGDLPADVQKYEVDLKSPPGGLSLGNGEASLLILFISRF